MTEFLHAQSHIVVVDAQPVAYRGLVRLAGEHGWHAHLLTCGRAAIRLARFASVDLWMIAIGLPDMSGFDLVQMLRQQPLPPRVFLVSDAYDAKEERGACACGAALYLCKSSAGSVDCNLLLDLLAGEVPH